MDADTPASAAVDRALESAGRRLARATPRRLALPGRGIEIALLDWGGDGPLALLHHANGFCKGAYVPLAEGLASAGYRVVAMDARGHGDSGQPEGESAYHWDDFALDLRAVAEALAADRGGRVALGIGHSFGGTSMLGAAARAPGLFERLVLVDPVTPPPPPAPSDPPPSNSVLAEGARRRRSEWASHGDAVAWWREKALFAAFPLEAIAFYALDGLRARPDGSVVLKCPPHIEAAVFSNSRGLDLPGLVEGVVPPTLWLWAAQGNFLLETYTALADRMADARVEALEAGHLVALEAPDRVLASALRFAPARPGPHGGPPDRVSAETA